MQWRTQAMHGDFMRQLPWFHIGKRRLFRAAPDCVKRGFKGKTIGGCLFSQTFREHFKIEARPPDLA